MNLEQLSHPLANDADLEARLQLLSEIERSAQAVQSDLSQAIASAQSIAEQRLTWRVGQDTFHASEIVKAIGDEILAYAQQHRERLFQGKQTAKLRNGDLKFRKVPEKVAAKEDVSAEQIVEWLRELLPEAVRTREEINFARLRDDYQNNKLTPADLDALGLQVVTPPEKFSVDVTA